VQTDQLTVFTDRAETQSFTLYRQPYQEQGEEADHALLMLQFNDDSPIPLHSPHIVIEAFDLTVPPSPIETGDPDLQPYVQLYLRARPQKKQGESWQVIQEDPARFSPVAFKTTFSLRNVQASQYKT